MQLLEKPFVSLPQEQLEKLHIGVRKFHGENGCWVFYQKNIMLGEKWYSAKNLFYKLYKGDVPKYMGVRNNCGNRDCVNPNHLEIEILANIPKTVNNIEKEFKVKPSYQRTLKHDDVVNFYTFFEKKRNQDCWLWKGKLSNGGYGLLELVNGDIISAHRFSFTLYMCNRDEYDFDINYHNIVYHVCGNRHCINPHHLYMERKK